MPRVWLFTRWLIFGYQVSELETENERLEKENGELKLELDSRGDNFHSGFTENQYQGDEQLHELQDKVNDLYPQKQYCMCMQFLLRHLQPTHRP